jgi:hypothetical protein
MNLSLEKIIRKRFGYYIGGNGRLMREVKRERALLLGERCDWSQLAEPSVATLERHHEM